MWHVCNRDSESDSNTTNWTWGWRQLIRSCGVESQCCCMHLAVWTERHPRRPDRHMGMILQCCGLRTAHLLCLNNPLTFSRVLQVDFMNSHTSTDSLPGRCSPTEIALLSPSRKRKTYPSLDSFILSVAFPVGKCVAALLPVCSLRLWFVTGMKPANSLDSQFLHNAEVQREAWRVELGMEKLISHLLQEAILCGVAGHCL